MPCNWCFTLMVSALSKRLLWRSNFHYDFLSEFERFCRCDFSHSTYICAFISILLAFEKSRLLLFKYAFISLNAFEALLEAVWIWLHPCIFKLKSLLLYSWFFQLSLFHSHYYLISKLGCSHTKFNRIVVEQLCHFLFIKNTTI